jgi:aromatic ring-cleaving dioxygenase
MRFAGKRGRWVRAQISVAAVAVAVAGIVGVQVPAHAQKLYETTRYQSVNQPIANWTTFNTNGYPVGRDPNCQNFAGVRRSSRVWATTYGIDESLHTTFAMQFHTTYSRGVAAAVLAGRNARSSRSSTTTTA